VTESQDGLYVFTPNNRTKRVEVFKDVRGRDVFVGSMGENPSEAMQREMIRKIEAEVPPL
jgi:hypothetical protein